MTPSYYFPSWNPSLNHPSTSLASRCLPTYWSRLSSFRTSPVQKTKACRCLRSRKSLSQDLFQLEEWTRGDIGPFHTRSLEDCPRSVGRRLSGSIACRWCPKDCGSNRQAGPALRHVRPEGDCYGRRDSWQVAQRVGDERETDV